jgi:hypothetical protein
MKRPALCFAAVIAIGSLCAQELPKAAIDAIAKLSEFERSELSKARKAVNENTRAVIAYLQSIQAEEAKSGNLDGALALKAQIEILRQKLLDTGAPATSTELVIEPKRPINVPEAAKYFNGSWYQMVTETVTQIQARQKAERMGGHLAWTKSEETHRFLISLAGGRSTWIDGSDEEVEGTWKWSDGTKFTFSAWTSGNPDNYGGDEDHLVLTDQGWNDFSADKPDSNISGFIVQWDITK